ncbi:MAG TPA: NAD(P)H-dependent oxidoreductase subunit E [Terriglobia bacterium]|jgi:bidirectional [NiFe] hydrogenase diaphorase subunit|nr:NAD(P)H-dependent oxidoreductase subunit E [Terriglobia bacterium]
MPIAMDKLSPPSGDKRWKIVAGTMRRHGYSRNALIETLHTVQQSFGFLDRPSLEYVAQSLRVPLSKAFGVATFYHFFSLKPPGDHTCIVCLGTACYIKGAPLLLAEVQKSLGIKPGETTPDRRVSVLTARCVGSCSLAPVALFDGEVAARLSAAQMQSRLQRWDPA